MARQKKLTLEELFAKAETLGLTPARPGIRADGTAKFPLEAAYALTRVMIDLGKGENQSWEERRFLSMDLAAYVMDNIMGSLNSTDASMIRERLGEGQEWYY